MRTDRPPSWTQARLGHVLTPAKDEHEVEDSGDYKLLGVRWYCDGSRLHDELRGENLKTRTLNRVRRGQITYNKMWVRKGAFAIVRPEHDGLYATNEYPTFDAVPGKLDTEFFGFLMETDRFQADAAALCKGTTSRARLNPKDFQRIRIALPPLPEQKKIAAILSSVDEAIQATQAVIEQTRRVKEGLLQDLLTRGIGHTRFKQTEIGEIPESWEVRKLGEVCRARQGLQIPISERSPSPAEGLHQYLTVKFLNNPGMAPEYVPAKSPRVLIRMDGLLVSRTGATGKILRNVEGVFHNNFFAVESDLNRDFLYHALNDTRVQTWIARLAGTTSIPDLNHGDFYFIRVPVPPMAEQRAIAAILDRAEESLTDAANTVDGLMGVKAGLLQDLLTGKVRVSV